MSSLTATIFQTQKKSALSLWGRQHLSTAQTSEELHPLSTQPATNCAPHCSANAERGTAIAMQHPYQSMPQSKVTFYQTSEEVTATFFTVGTATLSFHHLTVARQI